MLSCNEITLPYDMILYDKSVSKIDIVKQIAEELPAAPIFSYFLCDSWYVCEKLTEVFIRKGFYTVGAMKTNRIIYPYGVKKNVNDLAGKLIGADCRELFHLVTVKQRQYYVYRYKGNLNGIENAVVFTRYMLIAAPKRINEDDRTAGEIFFLLCDEVSDISFNQSMLLLVQAFLDSAAEILKLSDEQMSALMDCFLFKLPAYLRDPILISYVD